MGYLDNSSITVDAILTKKGRELLAKNDGSFNITSFALGDDEIDYSLFNENHPNGSQYAGEAIENMPVLEAFPDERNIMRHKLITLPQGTTQIPVISITNSTIVMNKSDNASITPTTLNFNGISNQAEPGGYKFTASDARLFSSFGTGNTAGNTSPVGGGRFSKTVNANETLNFTALGNVALFGSNLQLITSITVEGLTTGARATVIVKINKNLTANQSDTAAGPEIH
jgi:hypothetical protein